MAAKDRDTFIPIGISIAKLLLIASGQGALAAVVGEGSGLLTRLFGALEIGGKRAEFVAKIAEDTAKQLRREHQGISKADWHVAARQVASLIDQLSEKERLAAGYNWEELRRTFLDLGGTDLRSDLADESARQAFDWVLEVACQHIADCFTENEALASLLEKVDEVRTGIQQLADRPAGASQTREVVFGHNEVVQDLAPELLEDREREISELEAFVRSSQEAWYTIEAGMVSGKTALMSHFALNPPDGAYVVSFFTRRFGGDGNNWKSFAYYVGAQLADILGYEYIERPSDPASQDTEFRKLLRRAATACRSNRSPRSLILLIDGVDEDSYYENPDGAEAKSILSLLPLRLPEGVKLITASRPNPRPPEDIVCDAPKVFADLDPSPIAQKKINQKEIEIFFKSEYAADIGALLAASGGALTVNELRQLVAKYHHLDNVPTRDISACVDRSPGRMLMPKNAGFGNSKVTSFVLGHEAVLRAVLREIAPDRFVDNDGVEDAAWWKQNREEALQRYREVIQEWVMDQAGGGWRRATSSYILSNECFEFMLNRDVQVMLDPGRYKEIGRRYGKSRALIAIDRECLAALSNNVGELSIYFLERLLCVTQLRSKFYRNYVPKIFLVRVGLLEHSPDDVADDISVIEDGYHRVKSIREVVQAKPSREWVVKFCESLPRVLYSKQGSSDIEKCVAPYRTGIVLWLLANLFDLNDGQEVDLSISQKKVILEALSNFLATLYPEDIFEGQTITFNRLPDNEMVENLLEVLYEKIEDPQELLETVDVLAGTVWMEEWGEKFSYKALLATDQIEELWLRVEALGNAAKALDSINQNRARELIESTLEMIELENSSWLRGELLAEIAKVLVNVDKEGARKIVEKALKLSEHLKGNPSLYLETLATIVGSLADIDEKWAREIAEDCYREVSCIKESWVRAEILGKVAESLTSLDRERAHKLAGEAWEAAMQPIDLNPPEDFDREWKVCALIDAGEVLRAQDLAEQIENPWLRAKMFANVASALVYEDQSQALSIAECALKLVEQMASSFAGDRVNHGHLSGQTSEISMYLSLRRAEVFSRVATALVDVDHERAQYIAKEAQHLVDQAVNQSVIGLFSTSKVQAEVVAALAVVGLTGQAVNTAKYIENHRERSEALISAGLLGEAEGVVDEYADSISPSFVRYVRLEASISGNRFGDALKDLRSELSATEQFSQTRREVAEHCGRLARVCLVALKADGVDDSSSECWVNLARSALAYSWIYGESVWKYFDVLNAVAPDMGRKLVWEDLVHDDSEDKGGEGYSSCERKWW